MDTVEQMATLVGKIDEVTSRLSMIPWHLVEKRDSYALTVL